MKRTPSATRLCLSLSAPLLACWLSLYGSALVAGVVVPADFPDIQAAIDAAADGDEIIVEPGEYVIARPINFAGKNIVLRSEAGAERTTIRLADPEDPDLASVVLFENGETELAQLIGFTLTGGQGLADVLCDDELGCFPARIGGGVACFFASPRIAECVITRNGAVVPDGFAFGGGVLTDGGAPLFEDCVIRENVARGDLGTSGGGVECGGTEATFRRCTIERNLCEGAVAQGGGVSMIDSAPAFEECRILGNAARAELFATGGGVCSLGSFPLLVNCELIANAAQSPDSAGGAFDADGESLPDLHHCTLSANAAEQGAAIASLSSSIVFVTNAIVWGHTSSVAVDTTADVDVAYSCIEGPLAPGEGNLNVDPLFVAAGEYDFARTSAVEIAGSVAELPAFEVVPGDFRLREDSPAHDAALTELAAERDIAGRDRPCGDEADQGAHERCPEVGGISFLRGDADANGARELNDALRVLGHLFIGTAPLSCAAAADTDDSGVLDVTDATFLLDHLFLGGLQPPEPFATCGADPTTDDLGCAAYPPCL